MANEKRPDFDIVRCCANCHYFHTRYQKRKAGVYGLCFLPKVTHKDNDPLPAHWTTVCSCHVWKTNGKAVHKVAVTLGIAPPEGTI